MTKKTRCDVHLIRIPTTRQDWMADALSDMNLPGIKVHVVDGVVGNTGAGRALGFAQGGAEYVSFIDPDDRYPNEAITECIAMLDADSDAAMVYTSEIVADANMRQLTRPNPNGYSRAAHFSSPMHVHGLMVFRRDLVAQYTDEISLFTCVPEWRLTTRMTERGTILKNQTVGRIWRRHPGGVSSGRDFGMIAKRERMTIMGIAG